MKRVIDILQSLGGVRPVADALGAEYQTVHSWISRGFPASRAPQLIEFARNRGVKLTYEDVFKAKSGRSSSKESAA